MAELKKMKLTINLSLDLERCEEDPLLEPHLKERLLYRCRVGVDTCAMMLDRGSLINAASQTLVDRLGLSTTPHPEPYQLLWMDKYIAITMQVEQGNIWRFKEQGPMSALEKKKAEENKSYQAIDYDVPIESDKSTIGFGTRVGIGIAVVVFGLVFAFGDFLPYGSVSPSKESTVVKKKLSEEEKENFKRAVQDFEATLSKSPNDPTALEGAAVSLVELGEYEKASDLLEKLVKVIPDKAEAYRLLGEVKFELKDYEGSSSSYRNSLSSSDNIDFDVLRGLTNSLLAAKKPDQAVEVILSCRQKLNEKSQTQPADLEVANNNGAQKSQDIDPIQVDLLLGKAYSDWGHISDAVTVYDKLITEHPEDFRGYLAKGIILRESGKAGDAERMFIQAKFFAPEAAKALVDRYAQR